MKDFNQGYRKMKKDALNGIIETLEYYSGEYCDLHNEVFNTGYYIIGDYNARNTLGSYSIFDAQKKVKDYELRNFGETYTDITDPERLVNMLYYIIGEKMLYNIDSFNENSNNVANDETNKEIISEIEEILKDM